MLMEKDLSERDFYLTEAFAAMHYASHRWAGVFHCTFPLYSVQHAFRFPLAFLTGPGTTQK